MDFIGSEGFTANWEACTPDLFPLSVASLDEYLWCVI